MAHIHTRETTQRKNGKPVKTYVVVWKEAARDEFGLPIPVNPARPHGRKKQKEHQETYPTREAAEARRDELNAARHTGHTSALAEARKAGDLPFGFYAQGWLKSLQVKVSQGRLKQRTLDDYEKTLQRYALKTFAGTAVASITAEQCEDFLLGLVTQRSRQGNATDTLSPATVKHAWSAFGRVMKYAVQRGALTANPVDRVDFTTNHATGDHEDFEPNPLSAEEVAQLSAAISGELVTTPSGAEVWVPTPTQTSTAPTKLPAYPVYGLMVTFLAYTGLRASENTGLEIRDLEFRVVRGQTRCTVHVRRTKTRKGGAWVTGTPKSKRSKRSVALPPWLAARMHAYLFAEDPNRAIVHPRSAEPTAPVWPSRQNCGGLRLRGQRVAVPFDWSQPMAMGTFYDTIMKPALVAVGLPASSPEVPATDTTPAIPAQRGVRLHDLRHTFAVMQLMAGTHFMQVSKWLGHSTFTLTLNTYGDWIPEEDGGAANNLPEPVAPTPAPTPQIPSGANVGGNVVSLFGRRSG